DAVKRPIQGNTRSIATALGRRTPARVLDEDSPHRFGRRGEELPFYSPGPVHFLRKPQINLVHQSRRLERMTGSLAPHLLIRDRPQLRVHLLTQRRRVARAHALARRFGRRPVHGLRIPRIASWPKQKLAPLVQLLRVEFQAALAAARTAWS